MAVPALDGFSSILSFDVARRAVFAGLGGLITTPLASKLTSVSLSPRSVVRITQYNVWARCLDDSSSSSTHRWTQWSDGILQGPSDSGTTTIGLKTRLFQTAGSYANMHWLSHKEIYDNGVWIAEWPFPTDMHAFRDETKEYWFTVGPGYHFIDVKERYFSSGVHTEAGWQFEFNAKHRITVYYHFIDWNGGDTIIYTARGTEGDGLPDIGLANVKANQSCPAGGYANGWYSNTAFTNVVTTCGASDMHVYSYCPSVIGSWYFKDLAGQMTLVGQERIPHRAYVDLNKYRQAAINVANLPAGASLMMWYRSEAPTQPTIQSLTAEANFSVYAEGKAATIQYYRDDEPQPVFTDKAYVGAQYAVNAAADGKARRASCSPGLQSWYTKPLRHQYTDAETAPVYHTAALPEAGLNLYARNWLTLSFGYQDGSETDQTKPVCYTVDSIENKEPKRVSISLPSDYVVPANRPCSLSLPDVVAYHDEGAVGGKFRLLQPSGYFTTATNDTVSNNFTPLSNTVRYIMWAIATFEGVKSTDQSYERG